MALPFDPNILPKTPGFIALTTHNNTALSLAVRAIESIIPFNYNGTLASKIAIQGGTQVFLETYEEVLALIREALPTA